MTGQDARDVATGAVAVLGMVALSTVLFGKDFLVFAIGVSVGAAGVLALLTWDARPRGPRPPTSPA